MGAAAYDPLGTSALPRRREWSSTARDLHGHAASGGKNARARSSIREPPGSVPMERCLPRLHSKSKFSSVLLAFLLLITALVSRAPAQERRPVDEAATSRVFGRVVDAKGVAVRGARVELHAVISPWSPEEQRERFEVASDATGKFELLVPTPTSDWVSLWIRPSSYLDIAARDFGPAGGRKRPRLVRGDNDLGTFELQSTGAFAGRVAGAQGEPIVGAQVRLAGRSPGGLGRGALSNERGEYEVGHVPAGEFAIEVLAEGYQLAKRREVVVATAQTTAGVDFVLERATTISGVVVDESGVGIANARVWGWPKSSGAGSGARTDAQGRFVVHLKQNEPHVFEVEAAGFAKLDSFGALLGEVEPSDDDADELGLMSELLSSRGKHHAPGASDVRFVLQRPVLTRFVVLDAQTSAPVTEYAVRLEWKLIGSMTRSGGEPEFLRGQHPGGEFECEADPARHTYVITAPGYGPARGEIVHDSPQTRRCIVRVTKGGGLVGHVTVDGKPVEGAKVILRDTTLEELFGEPVADEDHAYWHVWDGWVDPFLGDEGERMVESDAQGRFRFDSLESGEHRLEITTTLGERRSIEPIRIDAATPLDLGQVELFLAGELTGRVLTPPDTSPAGLKLTATVFDIARHATTDAEGRFRIPMLPAGLAHVSVHNQPGVLAWFPTQHFRLAPDQALEVVLDASGCAGASVAIVARIDGQPAEKLNVYLNAARDPKQTARLNSTDTKGATSGWVSAIGESDLEFHAPSRMLVAALPRAAVLSPGASVSLELDLAVGQLAFEWPALPPGEKLQQVEFEGRRADRAQPVHAVWFRRQRGFDADLVQRSEQRCEFRWVHPGECEWKVRVISSSAAAEHIERNYRRSVTVVAGALAECVVGVEHQFEPPREER